jgi:gliding motility-associated-like protein
MKKLLFIAFSILLSNAFAQTSHNIPTWNGTAAIPVVNTCNATFFDNGGSASNYTRGSNYAITFCPSSAGEAIIVSFTQVDITGNRNGCTHFLNVYQGTDLTAAPDLVCGTLTGAGLPRFVSTDPGGCLTFVFDATSNGGTGAGFAANVTCYTPCISPTANFNTQTLDICPSSALNPGSTTISFDASSSTTGVYFSPTTHNIANYFWEWGDGTTSTTTTPTTTKTYTNPGIYVVKLRVFDNNFDLISSGCVSNNSVTKTINVIPPPALNSNPAVSTTVTDCSGCINLSATSRSQTEAESPPVVSTGTVALPDGSGVSYTSGANYSGLFPTGATMAAGCYPTVTFTLEHSWGGDLIIDLVAPNGQFVRLFNRVGSSIKFGRCVNGADNGVPGCGATYTVVPTGGTAWAALVANVTTATATCGGFAGPCETGNYWRSDINWAPSTAFTNLNGAPLNGTWTLRISDNLSLDDGTLFGWTLTFPNSCYRELANITPDLASLNWSATTGPAGTQSSTTTTVVNNPGPDACPPGATCVGNELSNSYNVCFTAANNGTHAYNAITTDEFGCQYRRTVNVTVNCPGCFPSAGSISNDQTICVGGDPAILNSVQDAFGGTGTNSYQWQFSTGCTGTWTNIASATGPTYDPPSGLTQTTCYRRISTNSCDNNPIGTNVITVTVNSAPSMTSSAALSTCSGVPFNLELTSNLASNYTWVAANNASTTGESTTNQTTTTINDVITNNTSTAQTVTYTVTPSSIAGSCPGTPQTVTVTVNPLPAMTSTNAATICSDQTLNIELTSSVASTYSWVAANNASVNGESLTNQTTSTINNTLTNTSNSVQTVTYTVTPTSSTGSCLGAPQTVNVTINPAPFMTSANDTTICSGQPLNLGLSSSVASTYTWVAADNGSVTGESLTNQTTATINNTLTNSSNTAAQTVVYTVTPTSTTGTCLGTSQTVNVTVNPAPAMTSANSATICSGQPLNIGLTSSVASTYTWVAADNGSVTGESLTNQTTATINNTLTSSSNTAAQTVTYTVTPTSTSATCLGTPQTVNVTVNPAPAMTSTNAATICSGQPLNIGLTSSVASTYTWVAADNGSVSGESLTNQTTATINNTLTSSSNTTAQTVVYTVTPTSTTGTCLGTPQTVNVTVSPAPAMTSTNAASICSGQPLNIGLTSSVASTYTWVAADNANVTGESLTNQTTATINNTLANSSNTAAQTVVYTVTPTSTTGTCLGTPQTVNVTVNPAPAMTSANSATICSGQALNIGLTSSIASTYSWVAADNGNTTGESLTNQTTSTINNTITNISTSAQTVVYTVTPTSTSATCLGTPQTVNVTVNPTPTITGSLTLCEGGDNQLTGSGTPSGTTPWVSSNTAVATIDNNGLVTAAGVGTTNVTYTANTGCSRQVSVTVTSGFVADFTYNNSYCAINSATPTFVNGGSAGTFSSTSGLVFSNAATGEINLGASTPNTYTITNTIAADGSCPEVVETFQITINALPTATISGTTALCSGENTSVTLSGTPNATVTYTINGGSNQTITLDNTGNASISTGNLSANTTYALVNVNDGTCSQTQTGNAIITVNALPTATISGTTALCSGENTSVTLSGTPNATVTYTINGGSNQTITLDNTGNASVATGNLSANTTYALVNVNDGTCSQTQTGNAIITVNALPTATISGTTTLCSGENTSVTLSGTPNATVTYTINGGSNQTITLDNTGTASVTTGSLSANATYELVNVNDGTCSQTQTGNAIITVNTLPTATISGTTAICSGETASISFSGTPNSTVSYTLNGTNQTVTLDNTGAASVTTGSISANATYELVNVNDGTCSQTQTGNALITVNQIDDATFSYSSGTICISGSIVSPTISGTSGGTFTVSPSGLTINTSTGEINPITSALETYTVTYTTNGVCPSSSTFAVTVTAAPQSTFDYSSNSYCQVVGTTATISLGTGASAGVFSSTSGLVINSTTGEVNIENSTAGTYTVTNTIAAQGGCAESISTTQIVINALPTVSANNPTVCSGESVTLEGTGAVSYTWTGGVTNGVSFVPSTTDNYTVTGTDANNCSNTATITVTVNALPNVGANSPTVCSGESVTLEGTGAVTYTWTGGVTNGVSFVPSETTNYTVEGTDANGCKNTSSASVTVNALPTVNAGNDLNACVGSEITLSASGAITYVWDNGVTNGVAFTTSILGTTTYTVEGTDANGCKNTSSLAITVREQPLAGFTLNAAYCQNEGTPTPILNSGAQAGEFSSTTGLSINATTGQINLSASTLGTYTVNNFIAAENGCPEVAETFEVTIKRVPDAEAGSNIISCLPALRLAGTQDTESGITYSWSTTNNAQIVNNNDGYNPDVNLVAGTNKFLYTVALNGCAATDSVFVEYVIVKADFEASTYEGDAELTVNFENKSTNATTYNWNFANGSSESTEVNPTAVFIQEGIYKVLLTARNGECLDTISKVIKVNAVEDMFIPNVFSPNGDGVNDTYKVRGGGFTEFKAYIFNRWGNPIKELNSADEVWDGKTKGGNDVSEGVYFIRIIAKRRGEDVDYKGTVTVVK